MLLNAIPDDWDHVAAYYVQTITAINSVSFTAIRTAILAEHDCYEFLSFFVSLNVSSHYAVPSSVGLIHASSIVSSYVLPFVLHVVSLSFHTWFRLFICMNI